MSRRDRSSAMSEKLPAVLLVCLWTAVASCGQAGGDPSDAGVMSGGVPGAPCSAATFNEGCAMSPAGPARMKCEPATSAWGLLGVCPAEHRCVEYPTPGGGVGNVAECLPLHEIDAGSGEPDAGPQPKLAFSIATVATTEYLFSPGVAGGEAKQQAVVLLQNVGAAPLNITKLDWSSKNFSLQFKMLKANPTMPLELDVGASIEAVVLYSYDPKFPDTSGGTLLIESDDASQAVVKLVFSFAKVGGTLSVSAAKLEFVDPAAGKADIKCVSLGNIGDGDVAFEKAVFEKESDLWQVASAPAVGTKLASGSDDKFEVCAQVKPAGPKVEHNNALLVHVTDAINSPVRVELMVKWVAVGDFLLKCEALDGTVEYNFKSDKAKTKRLCTLTNKIAEPLNLTSLEVFASEKQFEPLVAQLYDVDPYTIVPGDGQVSFSAPKTLVTNESAFLPVTFYPGTAPLTDAELRIGYTHGTKNDTLVIPILSKP